MGLYEDIINNKKKKKKQEDALFKEITSGKFKQRDISKNDEIKTTVKQEETMSPIRKPVESSGYDELYTTMTPTTDTKLLKQNKEISDERYNKARKILANKVKESNLETKPYDQKATSYKELKENISDYASGKNTIVQNIEKKKQKAKLAESSDVKSAKNKRAVSTSQYEVQKAKEDYKGPSAQELLMSPIRGAGSLFKTSLRDDLIVDDDFDRKLPSYNDTIMSLNQSQDNEIYNTAYGFASELGKQGTKKLLDKVSYGVLGNTLYYKSIYDQVYSSARDEGYSKEDAGRYAIANVGGEAALENLIGGSKYLTGGKKTIGDKAFSGLFKGLTKSKFVNDFVSSAFSEGGEEGLENQYELLMHQLILEKKFDPKAFISKSNIVDTVKSIIIGAGIGGTSTASQRVSNVISNPNTVKYEDAIYRIESETGEKVSDYNKNAVANLINELSAQGIKTSDKEIANLYNSIKNVQAESFENNAISQYSNLDDNSRVLYNNEIKDISNFIRSTGVNVRFDQNLTDLSEWKGNTLVINPSMTDTPIKTLLLKELGTNLLDEDTKVQLIDKLKKNGMYDNLKEYIQSQGIEENRVDNEIVSLEMNSIFESEEKLKEFAKTGKLDLQEIKSTVDDLSQKLTPSTKDYVYIKSLQDRINKLNINENNLSAKELQEVKQQEEIEQKQLSTKEAQKPLKTNDIGQFTLDTTKYTGMGKKTLENAVNSGIINDSIEARDFVNNFLAKVSEDKGIEFNFVDNKKLKEMGRVVKDAEGKELTIGGIYDNGVVSINLDSKNKLNVIVGHEITHAIDNSKYFNQLEKTVKDFLGNKEYSNRLKELQNNYANVENANLQKELVSDVIGEELFTNKGFIDELTKNKNLFEKIYSEIKYMWNQLRGKNTKMDKLMHDFTKAYREKIIPKVEIKYSLDKQPVLTSLKDVSSMENYGKDTNGRTLSKDVLEFNKDNKIHTEDGALISVKHTTTFVGQPFTKFDPIGSRPPGVGYRFDNNFVIYTTNDEIMSGSYANSDLDYMEFKKPIRSENDIERHLKDMNIIYPGNDLKLDKIDGAYRIENIGTESYRDAQKLLEKYSYSDKPSESMAFHIMSSILRDSYASGIFGDEYNKEWINGKINESIQEYENILDGDKQENINVVNSLKNILKDTNELMDKYDYKYPMLQVLTGRFDKSLLGTYYYENEKDLVNKAPNDLKMYSNANWQYEMYINLKNPYVFDFEGNNWNNYKSIQEEKKNIYEKLSGDDADKVRLQYKLQELAKESQKKWGEHFLDNVQYDDYKNACKYVLKSEQQEALTIMEMFGSYESVQDSDMNQYYNLPTPDTEVFLPENWFLNVNATTYGELFNKYIELNKIYDNYGTASSYFDKNVTELLKNTLTNDEYQIIKNKLYRFVVDDEFDMEKAKSKYVETKETNQLVWDIILKNEREGTNYDGIIMKNVKDYGNIPEGYDWKDLPPADLYIAFSPEQLKSVYNDHPTNDPDMFYSLQQKAVEKGNYAVYGKDIKYNPLVKKSKEVKQETKNQVKETETTNEETELKETYKSNEKIPSNVKKGTYIEPTSPINQESKKGKKLVKRLESKNSFLKQFSKDYTKLVDKLHPIEELAEASGNKQLYPKFNNIGMSEGTAQYQIGTGQTDINGNAIKDSKSLNEVWKPVEDAKLVNEFNDYLAHRLNIERYSKVPVWDKSITPENSQEIVDEYEEKYPEFKNWAEDVYKYNDNQLQKMIDSGLAKENAREWLYSNYVTIARDLGPKTSPLIEGSKNIKTKSPIRKAKGGTQPILPMKDSMARQTILTEKAIASNIAGLELLNVLGGTVGEKTYLKSLTNEGENNALIKNQDGTYSYTVYKNGSPVTMQITKELADAIMPTKPNEWEEMLPLKAIRGVSKLQRALLTDKNPLFILTNFFKDIGDAPLNSKYGAGEFYLGYTEAVSQMINNSSLWKQYVAKGGKENTYFDTKTGEVKQPKNVITKSLKGIAGLIENANQFVEQAPRFTEFLLTLQHGGTIDEAIYNSAEITTNFARGGEITKALNRNGVNFLNASVQGFDKQIRNFSKQPGAKAYVRLISKAIMLGVAPALLNHIILGDDDDYEELPDYVKDNYYLFKTSDNNFFRLPKGRVMSIFGTAARHTYEVAKGNEDVISSLKDTGEQFINNVAPNNPLENNILSPLLSVKNNKSWNGSPIVSKRLESLPESEQYDEKTSEIAKGIANSWVGKLAKWSPKKIDYLLDQYTGAIGDYVLPMTTPYAESREDNFAKKIFLSPLKSKFSVNSTISNKYTSEFYEVKEKLEKDLKVAGNIEDSEETLFKSLQSKYLASVNEELAELYAEKREIQSDTSLKDSEKYEKSLSIQREIDNLAKFALEDYKNAFVSNTYGTIGNKEFNIELNQGKLGWTKISDKEKKKQEEYSTKYDMTPEQYYSMDGLTKSTITGEDIYKYDEINKKLTTIRDNTTNDKEETIDYISGLDLSLPQKAMYMRMYYKSFNDYNDDIINYVDSLDISYDDKKSILIKLGIWK